MVNILYYTINYNDKCYHDQDRKNNAWRTLAMEFNVTGIRIVIKTLVLSHFRHSCEVRKIYFKARESSKKSSRNNKIRKSSKSSRSTFTLNYHQTTQYCQHYNAAFLQFIPTLL